MDVWGELYTLALPCLELLLFALNTLPKLKIRLLLTDHK
jgi:hypothetical protein